MSLPHVEQHQIPFSMLRRSSDVRLASYLGPPGDAAVTCAATPTFTVLVGLVDGPEVSCRQPGFEQRIPTLFAKSSLVSTVKSSCLFTVLVVLLSLAWEARSPQPIL